MRPASRPRALNTRSLLEGALFLALALGLLVYALHSHFSGIPVAWTLSPSLFPLLIGGLLLVLSISLLYQGFRGRAEDAPDPPPVSWGRAAVTMGAALACFLLMPLAGFVLATAGFLLFMFLYLGERRPVLLILLPLGFSSALYLLFGKLLHVLLPASPLDFLRRGLDLLL